MKVNTRPEAVEDAAVDLEMSVDRRSFRDNDGVQEGHAAAALLRALLEQREALANALFDVLIDPNASQIDPDTRNKAKAAIGMLRRPDGE